MKTSIITRAIAVAMAVATPLAATASPDATGFAPWAGRGVVDTPDAVQADVSVAPWGVDVRDWPTYREQEDVVDARQAQIDVKPWYIPGAI